MVAPSPSAAIGEQTGETALGESLSWKVHLLAANPGKAWVLAGGLLLAAVVGGLAMAHWIGSLLGAVFVATSTAEFWLPISYRITDEGAFCSYGLARLELPWSRVRRVIELPEGVRLSPFPRPTRLDAFRGIMLRYPLDPGGPDRAVILTRVRVLMEANARVR